MDHGVSKITLREMVATERPQERLERLGPEALSDTELLAMILRSGSKEMDVMSLSAQIVTEANSLSGLLRWSLNDFQRWRGIGKIKALQLLTVMEMSRRILHQSADQKPILKDGPEIYRYLRPRAEGLEVEKVWVASLDSKMRLIECRMITQGIANASLIHPREVFREAIRANAAAVAVAHNHPSGDPTPSLPDVQITRTLRDSARILDLLFIDHVVLGVPGVDPRGLGYYSFREAGMF
ncbi:MAG: DNA repair protein RadC [Verrucomicrobiota bacterium JB022]|nr:DNA repair protein RadC [Verrucomicrobiota bacterium JB022]